MPAKKSVVQKSSTSEPQLMEHVEPKDSHVESKEAPVVLKSKKPVKKSDDIPVVQSEPTNVVQEGGKKSQKKSQDVKSEDPTSDKSSKPKPKPKAKAKQTALSDKAKPLAKKVVKKEKKVKKSAQEGGEVTDDVDNLEESDKLIRSFKVKLPNKEEFEGRFTGLTPYQAANKALSKYFREVDDPNGEVTFCIIESTRKSKKTVYTYIGKRYKLEVPVVYKIQDGREIVKNFKNSLKKIKKADLTQ